MEENLKQLLLKDLCARLPYRVKVRTPYNDAILRGIVDRKGVKTTIDYTDIVTDKQTYPIRYIKPYLRPMSSMTEEERKDLLVTIVGNEGVKYFQVLSDGSIDNTDATIQDLNKFNMHWVNFDKDTVTLYLDWLNTHYFDYRGLIEKGLAIAVTEENNPY